MRDRCFGGQFAFELRYVHEFHFKVGQKHYTENSDSPLSELSLLPNTSLQNKKSDVLDRRAKGQYRVVKKRNKQLLENAHWTFQELRLARVLGEHSILPRRKMAQLR